MRVEKPTRKQVAAVTNIFNKHGYFRMKEFIYDMMPFHKDYENFHLDIENNLTKWEAQIMIENFQKWNEEHYGT